MAYPLAMDLVNPHDLAPDAQEELPPPNVVQVRPLSQQYLVGPHTTDEYCLPIWRGVSGEGFQTTDCLLEKRSN